MPGSTSSPEAGRVVVTGARVQLAGGRVVALIERIGVGGGVQVVTVDGVPEERVHPSFELFHVRLLSQAGPMVPDVLEDAETWDEACRIGVAYAAKVEANSAQIADLKEALGDGGRGG